MKPITDPEFIKERLSKRNRVWFQRGGDVFPEFLFNVENVDIPYFPKSIFKDDCWVIAKMNDRVFFTTVDRVGEGDEVRLLYDNRGRIAMSGIVKVRK